MIKRLLVFALLSIGYNGLAQEKVGDRWVDNNLTLSVTDDQIKTSGVFTLCVMDSTTNYCVENLVTGVEVEIYNEQDEILWKGIGSGRTKRMKLIAAMPDAHYMLVRAFKSWVVNKSSGNSIHQDKRIEIKYFVK